MCLSVFCLFSISYSLWSSLSLYVSRSPARSFWRTFYGMHLRNVLRRWKGESLYPLTSTSYWSPVVHCGGRNSPTLPEHAGVSDEEFPQVLHAMTADVSSGKRTRDPQDRLKVGFCLVLLKRSWSKPLEIGCCSSGGANGGTRGIYRGPQAVASTDTDCMFYCSFKCLSQKLLFS